MTGTSERTERTDGADRVEVSLGHDARIDPGAVVGYRYASDAGPTVLGAGARVRAQSIVYGDVVAGDGFTTGHGVLVREETTAGDDVLVGSGTVVDGEVTLGSAVSLQSQAYLPPGTEVGDRVFVGPGATLTNDPYPVRADAELDGPTLEADVSVGANATVLPGVTVGERSFVAAGAVVAEDVPPGTLATGVPAEHRPLPPELHGRNDVR